MSLFSRFSAVAVALGVLFFAGAALACDDCGGYYGGREIYSCNNALYDCRVESSSYRPRCDDGCYRHRSCDSCRGAYVRGFRDGFETARYEGDDRGPHDGYRGDEDRDHHDGHDWHDGDHRENHDDHDGHDRDHHDGDEHDWHDGDHHDDHHDGDQHDGR